MLTRARRPFLEFLFPFLFLSSSGWTAVGQCAKYTHSLVGGPGVHVAGVVVIVVHAFDRGSVGLPTLAGGRRGAAIGVSVIVAVAVARLWSAACRTGCSHTLSPDSDSRSLKGSAGSDALRLRPPTPSVPTLSLAAASKQA